ncbi:MAG: serine protease Do [Crocinitomix sp.]|jgi:serine protease Do
MEDRQHIALFDRYLSGEMDNEEKLAFEERLTHSESLKKAFNEYTAFSTEIEAGGEYAAIKTELGVIHQELYRKKRSKLLSPKFLIPIGLAATITLVFMISPWSGMKDATMAENNIYEPLANNSGDNYAEESDDIMYDMVMENVGNSNPDSAELNQEYLQLIDSLILINQSPHGTAFLISEDGFFLTSKHLIEGQKIVDLQQKELGITFESEVIYSDSILDFAILKSSIKTALNFEAVPYEIVKDVPELGDAVFTLGYTKKDIVYTQGVVSSETGFESDSVYFEVSLPSNAGHSGAPLFNEKGNLIGIITAHLSDKQAVTYILRPDYIQNRLDDLSDSLSIDLSTNYSKKNASTKRLIKLYRPFIFEVH